jgi:hypothetical protein
VLKGSDIVYTLADERWSRLNADLLDKDLGEIGGGGGGGGGIM